MSTRFPAHTSASATGAATERLAELERRHGDVGTMVRTMAGSPSVLIGYLELSRAMKRSKLDRQISERISLAVQDTLRCDSCLQAHTDAARSLGISDAEIQLARSGSAADARTAAIVGFGRRVHTDPASVTAHDAKRSSGTGCGNATSSTSWASSP